MSLALWCPEGDLNSHSRFRPADFKSAASADFAIRAFSIIVSESVFFPFLLLGRAGYLSTVSVLML